MPAWRRKPDLECGNDQARKSDLAAPVLQRELGYTTRQIGLLSSAFFSRRPHSGLHGFSAVSPAADLLHR